MPRPYYALNGDEVVEIIKKEVERSMLNSGKFGISRSFPQVSWKWTLEMDVYPSEPPTSKIETKGTKKVSEPNDRPELVVLEDGKEGIGEKISPDQVRVDEGLKMPNPVQKKGAGIVDELLDSLK